MRKLTDSESCFHGSCDNNRLAGVYHVSKSTTRILVAAWYAAGVYAVGTRKQRVPEEDLCLRVPDSDLRRHRQIFHLKKRQVVLWTDETVQQRVQLSLSVFVYLEALASLNHQRLACRPCEPCSNLPLRGLY